MKSVLVVDDDVMNQKMAGFILGQKNYSVKIASSGMSAIQTLEKESFDLILLDIEMPEMDGFETFEIIKANDKMKEIPVMFLTASVEQEIVDKAMGMGAVDYVKKPFLPADLQAHVAKVIGE